MKGRCATLTSTLLALICLNINGCCNCPKQPPQTSFRVNPATLSMPEVVGRINANNQRISSLWASLNYSATIHDRGQAHSVSSDDGILLYRGPSDMRLVGKKEFVGTVFDIGTNGREYWLEVIPGTSRMWWGTYADLQRLPLAQRQIPIQPQDVLAVLGVQTIDTNFLAQPVPVMRYDNAADAYVFLFNYASRDRWLAQKEIWYDRGTLRPRRVVLYDPDGRPILQANLSHDVRVQVPDQPNAADWPVVAGDFKLFFPDSGSRMEFYLKDVRLYKQQGRVQIPNPASFRLPDVQGTDVQSIQIPDRQNL